MVSGNSTSWWSLLSDGVRKHLLRHVHPPLTQGFNRHAFNRNVCDIWYFVEAGRGSGLGYV